MSSRRAWTGITVALVVAVCVWWLAADTGVPSPPLHDAPARPAPDVPATSRSLPRAERVAANAPITQVPYGSIAVHVVLADGTAAVGAEVRIGPVRTPLAPIDLDQDEAWQRFSTGAEATAFVPWSHVEIGVVSIAARHGGQWGRIQVPSSTHAGTRHTIELQPDQTFVVRVVDGDDNPVPEVMVTVHGPPSGLAAKAVHEAAYAWTTANGLATFRHAQGWIPDIAPLEGVRPLVVRSGGLASCTALELDGNHLPREPVTLRLGDFGRIDVLALEADGSPIENGAVVCVRDDADNSTIAVVTDGRATCPVVSVGATLHANLLAESRDVTFPGPSRRGEVVTIELRADACPLLTGQVRRDGAPLPSAPLRIQSHESMLFTTATSDDDGRFRCRLRTAGAPDQSITVEVLGDDGNPTGWHAQWHGPLAATGEQDLGVLTLVRAESLPLIAAGRIVTTAPLEGVHLDVTPGEPHRGSRLDPPPETIVRADGSFEVRGTAPDEELRIGVVAHRQVATEEVRFQRGQRDLVLRLEPEQPLTARFVVPSRAAAMALHAVIRVPDDDDWMQFAPDERSFDGSILTCRWWFGFEQTCELRACAFRDGPALHSIADVVVGRSARPDPRLDRIELRLPRLLRITVPAWSTDEGVGWPTEVEVLDGDETIGKATELDERTWLVFAEAPVDLRVTVPGFRSRILRAVHTDTEVSLAPAIVVVFECTLRDLTGLGSCSLYLFGPTLQETSLREGVVQVRLSAPGRYELSAHNCSHDIDLVCEPSVIEVGENGGGYQLLVRPK